MGDEYRAFSLEAAMTSCVSALQVVLALVNGTFTNQRRLKRSR